MLRTYKTEIHPTKDQIIKINQSLGVCRLDEFIKTFLEADSELLKRVQEIVANHVTTY